MTSEEIKEKLKIGTRFKILDEEFKVLEHIIWWQARINENYDKYVLLDKDGKKTSRLFISGGIIGLGKLIKTHFEEPLEEEIEFEVKKYKRATTGEFCVAKLVDGEEIYKEGDVEIWWDFEEEADSLEGLNLGRNWMSWEREDYKFKIFKPEEIEIL